MPWTIPNKGVGIDDKMSAIYSVYFDVLQAGIAGIDCVLSGCAVTAQGTPDMTYAVAKGAVLSNGALFAVTAANVTIGTAHGTHPRFDLIVVDSSGAKQVRAGTAASAPVPPARTANDVVLAVVFIPANDTALGSTQVFDQRVLRTQGPITLKKTTTAVTFNTTNAIQTYATITLPNGLFLAGRVLRVRCGGYYLANNTTPTLTLTIAYGGTTLFADVTGATTNDADRGAWSVDFDLNASGNAAQQLIGNCRIQTPGAKTAASTGIGDLSVTTHINTPLRGTAAVDSDSADRTLTVQWTMSVSNVNDEMVMDYATFELL